MTDLWEKVSIFNTHRLTLRGNLNQVQSGEGGSKINIAIDPLICSTTLIQEELDAEIGLTSAITTRLLFCVQKYSSRKAFIPFRFLSPIIFPFEAKQNKIHRYDVHFYVLPKCLFI